MTTRPKVTKKLSDIEIDEISLVDRSANQHAAVAIAKRAPEEETMPKLFNEEGVLLDENKLEDGQIVYDEGGQAYQFSLDEPDEEEGDEVEEDTEAEEAEEPEPEAALVGKNLGGVKTPQPSFVPNTGPKPAANPAFKAGAGLNPKQRKPMAGAGAGGGTKPQSMIRRPGQPVAKSFSEQIMEELSKAYSDEERDTVLSKAFAQVEQYQTEAQEAIKIAKSERDMRLTAEYVEVAKSYNLPVDENQLGPVLYRMAETMSYEDCTVIAKCLEAAGATIFEEIGYIGGGDNVDVMDQVNARVDETVTKSVSKGADSLGREDVMIGLFDSDPSAYDEYLAERRGY